MSSESMKSSKGGAYMPPARLRQLQASIKDKNTVDYQRMTWDSLKKNINGLINKANTTNIKNIVAELFAQNLIRGRGLFARSVMKAQIAAPTFTPVYASLVAVVNSKIPEIGFLVLERLVVQFRKSLRRNDKAICISSAKFIAHLINQSVSHEILALEVLRKLLKDASDDSVEVAVGFIKECGSTLLDIAPKPTNSVFDAFRNLLHEGKIEKRVQYMIEVLFQVRKDKFKDYPAIPEGLDLVEEEDQITHLVQLDQEINSEDRIDVFHEDPDFLENEAKYKAFKNEILGESESDNEGSNVESDEVDQESASDGDESEADNPSATSGASSKEVTDFTNQDLASFRKAVYLTIMSSLNFEEACHKLLKMELGAGKDKELCTMIVECCGQEKEFNKFYGYIGQRFCKLNRKWTEHFCQCFEDYYVTCHLLSTTKLRNIAKFFAFLLASDALPWTVLSCIHLNEDETSSSNRIFVKILMQDLSEWLGIPKLTEKFREEALEPAFTGLFPKDNLRNARFSINFFTAIGLPSLSDDLRKFLDDQVKRHRSSAS